MRERLKEVLKIQSESFNQWRMFAYLIRKIKAMENTTFFVANGNIYVTKESDMLGSIPSIVPCIVAHMDTVHKIVSDLSLIEVGNCLTGFNRATMTQTGIGGDDKVGIFIALEALNFFENIKVVFFRDEEVGCLGSEYAYMKFFDNCSMVLQCDRRGNDEFITEASGVSLSSKNFRKEVGKIIKHYGYRFARGMMTDVMTLKENGLPVSCANIACGYYNPHQDNEYVSVDDVINCRNMVFEIIGELGTQRFGHTYTPRWQSTYSTTGGRASYAGKDDWYTKSSKSWWDEPDDNWNPGDWVKGADGVYRKKKDESESHRYTCGSCGYDYIKEDVQYVPALNTWLCKKDCLPYFQEDVKTPIPASKKDVVEKEDVSSKTLVD